MEIKKCGSQISSKGSADWFTGTVRIDPLFEAPEPARVRGASVTFEPGARTAWHTHPLGQTLIVTSGLGWARREGGPIEEIRPGDVVWFAPNEKHWHGATPTTAMTHIAIQEALNGKPVDWMEKVSDEQYQLGDELIEDRRWQFGVPSCSALTRILSLGKRRTRLRRLRRGRRPLVAPERKRRRNIQRRMRKVDSAVRCSAFDVRCSVFGVCGPCYPRSLRGSNPQPLP